MEVSKKGEAVVVVVIVGSARVVVVAMSGGSFSFFCLAIYSCFSFFLRIRYS